MARHALIVGIDGYDNASWRLDGAVRDALAFADWVIAAGGVAASDVRLLLSPAPGAPPPVPPAGAPAPLPATSQGIIDGLAYLRELEKENGGDRVYVYYAGHGAALPLWSSEPILIPADFSNPVTHSLRLLGFSRIIPFLTPAPFPEQLFFLDACRDFGLPGYEPPLQSPVGPYRPVPGAVRQYVFYSVAPGQRAAEIGTGIWTKTLLDGLQGQKYQPVSRRGKAYEVSLAHLARWIRGEVSRRIGNAFLRDAAKYVQTPEYVPDPGGGDPVLVTYTDKSVPRVKIEVFVEPGVALHTCRVSVKQYVDGLGEEIQVMAGPPPPIEPPVAFDLRPADYSIQAEADQYVLASQAWTVEDEPVVELTLQAAGPPGVGTAGGPEGANLRGLELDEPRRGFRTLDLPGDPEPVTVDARPRRLRGIDSGDADLDELIGESAGGFGAAAAVGKEPRAAKRSSSRRPLSPLADRSPGARAPIPGTLEVRCPDPCVRVKLLDARRQEVGEGLVAGAALTLSPGIYRLQAWLPGDPPRESTVEVRPGRATAIELSVPASRLGELQVRWLQERQVAVEEAAGKVAYLHPSELLGPLAGVHLGSLLAYAAYAANWDGGYFHRLRSFAVPRFPAAGADACGVLVLVGVAGGRDESEMKDFFTGCSVALQRLDGASLGEDRFTTLAGMPAAAASQTVLERPGPLTAELRLPGFGATRYALAALPGRITVLVAVLEIDGRVDVQQLLLPLVQGAAPAWRDFLADPGDELAGPRNLRRADLALRAFAAGETQPLSDRDFEGLLSGEWIDPLLACAAGYSLVRAGQPERFLGQWPPRALHDLDPAHPARPARSWHLGPSALANLLNLFPGLPDAWVLAGLCGPGRRAGWFAKAGHRGVPLFAQGLRALGQSGPAVSAALAGLLPGSSWTAWTAPASP